MPVDTQATDTAAAPAASAPGTQTSAPVQSAPANAPGTGADASVTSSAPVPGTPPQTPQGTLAAAAEGQLTQQQAQLLAGKFKAVPDLEQGYKNAERQLTKLAQEKKALEEQLAQARPQQQPQGAEQKDAWMQEWDKHPLSAAPDPRYDPKGHAEWFENTFAPHFQNDPMGTIRHLVAPQMRAAQMEIYNAIKDEFQTRDTTNELTSFFKSKPEFLDKPVSKAFEEWGEEGLEQYQELLNSGVPVKQAVELIALRRGFKPLTQQVAAAQAKDQDLAKLASGAPSRGAAPSADAGLIGEGESLQEKMKNAYAKMGENLDISVPRRLGGPVPKKK